MLQKFETKSSRVKGIAFHPNRPWTLCALHSGSIQLWDYRLGTLIDVFEEHEGAVRGIDFHPTQPLFISGADDFKIKVWNYKTKRCITTLTGHMDYIRTVFFHHELPWIVSSSDDQTIRIWNYQSRQQISMMTGHGHYVMCAQFHPNKDLIVSASLDQTLRLWDFSPLRKKFMNQAAQNSKVFFDVEMIQVLEGHDRGVNWCVFHPTQNIIVSASDDRKIKIWKFSETKAWEQDTLYAHTHNVCCVIYHPKLNVLVSNSEDKTIRIWDMDKRTLIDTIKKENDRFWILAAHPGIDMIGAGSDSGAQFFNLRRERIPYVVFQNNLFFIYNNQLIQENIKTNKQQILKNLSYEKKKYHYQISLVDYNIRNLKLNTFDQSSLTFMIQIDNKEPHLKSLHFITFNYNADFTKFSQVNQDNQVYAIQGVFVNKQKVALLEYDYSLKIQDFQTHRSKKEINEFQDVVAIYPAPLGKLLVLTSSGLILYDTTSNLIINQYEQDYLKVKNVTWNENNQYLAVSSQQFIIIFNKNLKKICRIQEKTNLKSLIWGQDVIYYSTINHIKYGLINGDQGIIKCNNKTIYLTTIDDENKLHYIDKQGQIEHLQIQDNDLQFKLALYQKNAGKINQILKYLIQSRSKSLLGNSIVSYLYKKNYSGLALNLVQDPKAKFSLAIDSGNLEVACKQCQLIKDPECYQLLGEEATRQGNHQLMEVCYANQKSFEKLSFLYAITGNKEKLQKMLQLAYKRKDIQSRFHNSIYLGDVQERVKILAEIGQCNDYKKVPLAYMTAVTHNLTEMAQALKQSIEESLPEIKFDFESVSLVPPQPIFPQQSLIMSQTWPHHQVQEEDILLIQNQQEQQEIIPEPLEQDEFNVEPEQPKEEESFKDIENNDAWDVDDFDLPEVDQQEIQEIEVPNSENPMAKFYNSNYPGHQAALGNFEKCLELLKKQINVVNFEPLRQTMIDIFSSSQVQIPAIPFNTPLSQSIYNEPFVFVSVQNLQNQLTQSKKLISDYKLNESCQILKSLFTKIPFLTEIKAEEKDELIDIIRQLLDYSLAIDLELSKSQANPKRQLELSAYMCCCQVDISHKLLFLKNAMGLAYKSKNFIYSSYFAKKIINLTEVLNLHQANPSLQKDENYAKAKKVFQVCEQQASNAFEIDFDEKMLYQPDWIYTLDSQLLTMIKTRDFKSCPYCSASYGEHSSVDLCKVCNLSSLHGKPFGLKLLM